MAAPNGDESKHMLRRRLMVALATAAQVPAAAALGQIASPVAPAAAGQIAPDVAAAYDTYHIRPIWFRTAPDNAAIGQLVAILQRAPVDGFRDGPQLAAQVGQTPPRSRMPSVSCPRPGSVTSRR